MTEQPTHQGLAEGGTLSGEVRWTKRVARPAAAAVVVKISRLARATCGMVVLGKLLACRPYGV